MKEFDQPEAESLAWHYFHVILPVDRDKLRELYRSACNRLEPGARPSNTKGEYMAMRDYYHSLMEANPPWAFTAHTAARPRRPNRGKSHEHQRTTRFHQPRVLYEDETIRVKGDGTTVLKRASG